MKPNRLKLIENSVKKGNQTKVTALGNSMLPYIKSGTSCSISPTDYDQIKISDLVAYKYLDQLIIHKCIFKNSDYLFTWGTNNNFIDPPVTPDQVIGTVKTDTNFTSLNFAYQALLLSLNKQFPPSVKYIILKGGPWQKHLFGYYLNNPASDVDILIKPNDYHIFKNIFEKNGFAIKLPPWLTKDTYSTNVAEFGEISFSKIIHNQTFTIDLHVQPLRGTTQKLISPIPPRLNESLNQVFFDYAVQDSGLHFLNNTYQLIYICLNLFFQHGLRGIHLYGYIAFLVSQGKIDWEVFWDYCRHHNLTNTVYYPLSRTAYMFNLSIPDLNQHRPLYLQRQLMRFLQNRHTIFSVLPLGANKFITRYNTFLIILMNLLIKLTSRGQRQN